MMNVREEWKKWNRLNRQEKKQYFLDYYLLPTAGGAAAVILAVILIHNFLFPEPETELYVAIFDLTLDADKKEEAVRVLTEQAGNLKESQIILDDSFRSDSGRDLERLQVLIANHKLDAVIANDEIIGTLAAFGYFQDMTTLLTKEETDLLRERDSLFVTAGYRDTDEISFEDNETGMGEKKPYAVRLQDSRKWQEMTDVLSGYIDFAIVEEDAHPETAVMFLRYLSEGNGGGSHE